MNHIINLNRPKPIKDFKVHYWNDAYFSEERIELTYGMSKGYIYPDGSFTFTGGTMNVTVMYHLINEAMALFIFYYSKKPKGN